jgi:two-component system chemotaxis response regulator CheB
VTRVVVVDDSATVRRYLAGLFREAGDFEVVALAETGEKAVEAVANLAPDVVSLDVYLPGENAAQVVRRMLARKKVPIVLVSSATRDDDQVFEALAAGALGLVQKPRGREGATTASFLHAVRAVSRVKVQQRPAAGQKAGVELIAIASSTGGPGALRALLAELPRGFGASVLVAQHISPGFEDGLARWLGQATPLPVKVAGARGNLEPGTVLLGRPGWDLAVESRSRYLTRPAPERGYHPSGDVLFATTAEHFGSAAAAVVLAGIGEDGAVGAAKIAARGGAVLTQEPHTAVVASMPLATTRSVPDAVVADPAELGRLLLTLRGPQERRGVRPRD